ncbi:ABC transporter ATP-binding protein [Gordonia neofelifaecis]|uniref:ABC-type molybdenum transport system, ATPase component/photorepair protein PhrA n=1 Tax=Gordonia neofelifaecis NRRL B-59395 TaxID=644548 RepID=F1YNI2_9ACTN|nr:ATP-binding cassette domain-containing protein [Gordonia neofelifaecis]EGD53719.1 ABC-type molybdenum transport system, ATPase component/photorepair protein PhrA [Gordonia neofelifaecis NRRL B-59395]
MTDPQEVLRLDAVTFRRNGRQILHGIDLTVRAGEHWALLGPNGAGKTTIVGFCAAQTHPTSGTVDVLGKRLGRVDTAELRKHIGHVNPRHRLQTSLTVTEVVLTGVTGTIDLPMRWSPSDDQRARAAALVADVGMTARADSDWHTLSQGERGRALIARALIGDPELLLLDEPTTGLDVAAREQLLETVDSLAVSAPEVASVLVTHHLEELPESTSHAVVIRDGSVVAAGTAADTVTSEVITAAFAHPIGVDYADGRWSARAVRVR